MGVPTLPEVEEYQSRVEGVAAASAVLAELEGDEPAAEFVSRICSHDVTPSVSRVTGRFHVSLERVLALRKQLEKFFEPDHLSDDGVEIDSVSFERLEEILEIRLNRWNDMSDWTSSQRALERASIEGLGPTIDRLMDEAVSPEKWSAVFRRLVLSHCLDNVYRDVTELREFRGHEHTALIDRFKDLDHHHIDSGPIRLRRVLASRRANLGAAQAGEPALLRHEAAKRRRHMPLRRLFERIPNLLPTLKPCLMMSPLSVAQFLPADRYRFDVVIFDEASQVRPHDAIGAILRGRQLVVAGDAKQLPPTSFFDRADDLEDEEHDEDLRALESILDGLRAKNMPRRSLLWHYRSRHEDLIAYSNQHFYENRLITFPAPSAESVPGMGVRLEYVADGRYEQETDRVLRTAQRVNRVEAQRIAKLVMEHARNRSNESLGVVTLGSTQRDVVEDEIRQARMLDQSREDFFAPDKRDPFFVKALEQVQGDERDVMMIGIGFGKNSQGVLSHNFGPINRDGGERRLNVLVTRARHEVVVVSSIRASDIDLSRPQKLGPRLLKAYLDFAERGRQTLESQTSGGDGDYESPFEASVGEALERAGYTVHRQVGASKFRIDLAIVHPEQPGKYLLGIECDGATYHQSKTARDRDRLRQEVLEGLGWTIHRVWSTEWIRYPERELNQIVERIAELIEIGNHEHQVGSGNRSDHDFDAVGLRDEKRKQSPDNVDAVAGHSVVDASFQSHSAETYRTADVTVVNYGDILNAPLSAVTRAAVECVNVEGPIHKEVLARRIVNAWGHQRTGSRIASRMNQAILIAVKAHQVEIKGDFLRSTTNLNPRPRAADEFGSLRDIKHIAEDELLEGMSEVLRRAFSLTEEEVILHTTRFFGYQRTGADISRRLREVLSHGIERGIFELRGARYAMTKD